MNIKSNAFNRNHDIPESMSKLKKVFRTMQIDFNLIVKVLVDTPGHFKRGLLCI